MYKIKKSITVIINPISGTRSKKSIPHYFKGFDPSSFDIHFVITEHPGHATDIASKAVADNVDLVVAVGGDGTINEVSKALIGSNTVLGIIPVGSGNGLARSLGIPMNSLKAVDVVKTGSVRSIDYGVVNNHIFICTCGVGFDAQVSEKSLNQKSRGKLMYTKNMINTFHNFKPERYKIVTPDSTFDMEAFVVTCANAPQYGNNAYIAPLASLNDGLMNVSIIKPLSVVDVPQIALQMFSQKIINNRKFVEVVTPEVVIVRENEGVMHLDGNAIYTEKELNVKIVSKGLKVLVPSLAKNV